MPPEASMIWSNLVPPRILRSDLGKALTAYNVKTGAYSEYVLLPLLKRTKIVTCFSIVR